VGTVAGLVVGQRHPTAAEPEGTGSDSTREAAQGLPPRPGLAEAAHESIKPLRIHPHALLLMHRRADAPRHAGTTAQAGSAGSVIAARAIRVLTSAGCLAV
jgi:hypothetical protein